MAISELACLPMNGVEQAAPLLYANEINLPVLANSHKVKVEQIVAKVPQKMSLTAGSIRTYIMFRLLLLLPATGPVHEQQLITISRPRSIIILWLL